MKKTFENNNSAIETLIDSANKHSNASEMGDYKSANKNFTLIQKAVYYLRENDGINKLEELLNHKDISVRLAAASYFLAHNADKAILILENIVRQKIPHKSFEAKMVLDEYRKGNLKI